MDHDRRGSVSWGGGRMNEEIFREKGKGEGKPRLKPWPPMGSRMPALHDKNQ
jgi:hypothetical protein